MKQFLCLVTAIVMAKNIAIAFTANTKPSTSCSFVTIHQKYHKPHSVISTTYAKSLLYDSTSKLESRSSQESELQQQQEEVQVGSKEYYSGFVSRKIDEEPEERITGDAVLVPTMKFVGGFAAVLIALFFGFLASNGLL